MMKRVFIYASVVGLVAGVIYVLYKEEKSQNTVSKSVNKKEKSETGHQEEEVLQKLKIVDEMYQDKSERAQSVYERHSEAGEIMKDAYHNIMEDFVEDFSSENVVNDEAETKETVIDSTSVSVMKEIDSISDELDDLLK